MTLTWLTEKDGMGKQWEREIGILNSYFSHLSMFKCKKNYSDASIQYSTLILQEWV